MSAYLRILFKLALVIHMLSLAYRAFDSSRLLDVNVWLDADERHYAVIQRLDVWHLFRWIWREVLRTKLNIEVERVLIVFAVHCDEILWCEHWEFCEHSLNL